MPSFVRRGWGGYIPFIVNNPSPRNSAGSSPNREQLFQENGFSPLLGGVPRSGEEVV